MSVFDSICQLCHLHRRKKWIQNRSMFASHDLQLHFHTYNCFFFSRHINDKTFIRLLFYFFYTLINDTPYIKLHNHTYDSILLFFCRSICDISDIYLLCSTYMCQFQLFSCHLYDIAFSYHKCQTYVGLFAIHIGPIHACAQIRL